MFKDTIYLGHVATFYIPKAKLNKVNFDKGLLSQYLELYLISEYHGYTHQTSDIAGYYKKDEKVFDDIHEKYEVSFSPKERVYDFVKFLSGFCWLLEEDSLYLTMGKKSYLILPDKSNVATYG